MRNLILFAVAYSVALSEADVEQLGYEPTEEDFKQYFEIPAEVQQGEIKKDNFDAFGDLHYFLNDEEKAALDPDNINTEKTGDASEETKEEMVTDISTENTLVEAGEGVVEGLTAEEALDLPVSGEEVVTEALKDLVIPEQFKEKHKELIQELDVKNKTISDLEKDLEKLQTSNASKIEKSEEKFSLAESKAAKDVKNPVNQAASTKAKSDLNVVKKEATKTEKAATSAINKAIESLNKTVATFDKLKTKIEEHNAKAEAKKLAKDSKPKKETTPKVSKEEKAAKIEAAKVLMKENHVYTFVDYQTHEPVTAVFVKHSAFGDGYPAALVKQDHNGKKRLVSYLNLTWKESPRPVAETTPIAETNTTEETNPVAETTTENKPKSKTTKK